MNSQDLLDLGFIVSYKRTKYELIKIGIDVSELPDEPNLDNVE